MLDRLLHRSRARLHGQHLMHDAARHIKMLAAIIVGQQRRHAAPAAAIGAIVLTIFARVF